MSKDIDKYVGNLHTASVKQEYYLICVVTKKQDRMKILDNNTREVMGVYEFLYNSEGEC